MLPLLAAAVVASPGVVAAKPTLHFSARERSACRSEAIRFCAYTYPNKRDLVHCLQAHMSSLGNRCRRSLKQGVSERPSLSH